MRAMSRIPTSPLASCVRRAASICSAGSVANSKRRTWSAIRFRPVLHSDAEQSMDELTLAHRITLCQPADLSFANRMHCLVAFDGSPGSFRRPESEAGDDSLLDQSVVLLNHVVEIRRCSAATAAPQFAGLLQFADGTGIRRMPIHIDDSRPDPLASRQGKPQEKLRRR